MSNSNDVCDQQSAAGCDNRRDFLVKATATAGGLVLSLAGMRNADAATPNSLATVPDLAVKIGADNPLNKVGGFQTVESAVGKLTIARTGETTFAVVSAVCTHKGGPVQYDEKTKLFFCPNHGSKYGTDGSNAGGPSKRPLGSYSSEKGIFVNLEPKA